MTLPDVREVRDAWPPKRTLFLVPREDHDGCHALVSYLPRRDRAGNFLTCSACGTMDCEHCRAVVAYLPAEPETRPVGRLDPGVFCD